MIVDPRDLAEDIVRFAQEHEIDPVPLLILLYVGQTRYWEEHVEPAAEFQTATVPVFYYPH